MFRMNSWNYLYVSQPSCTTWTLWGTTVPDLVSAFLMSAFLMSAFRVLSTDDHRRLGWHRRDCLFIHCNELLLISWCFPLSRVRMSRRCFLTALRMRGTMWTVWWPSGQPIDVSSVSGRLAGQLTGLPMMRLWTDCQSCSHPHCYSHRLRCCTPQARWCSKYGPCARPELGHSYGWFSRLHEHSGRFSCRRVLPCLLDNPSGNPLWVSFLGRLGDGMDHRSAYPCMSCTGDILL